MKTFRFYNRILGWVLFLIASTVYLLTAEPTVSLWDCGEFIASAYKLQVGHPPGAPLFMIMARVATLFSFGNAEMAAYMVNALSAIMSALTIMFLYWSITHLALKFYDKSQLKAYQLLAILGSGVVGALAYTFSDTFWFSAVEAEVYASSSFFTAFVFWAILKWENVADEKFANRWLILIAYLMGLSIGVHLLNLLAIPAIVLVYYFKKYEVTRNGVIKTLLLSVLILGGVQYVIIPGVIWFASIMELFFVNSLGMPYKTGVLVYAVLLIGSLVYGIYYSHLKRNVIMNTALLVVSVIILGYSSYSMIVIRSLANPPMDENSPETVFLLQKYLNREQYGDRPLVKGQYFNSEVVGIKEGSKHWAKRNGKYENIDQKISYEYDSDQTTLFPRMYSADQNHVRQYLEWTGLEESDVFQPRREPDGSLTRNQYGDIVYDWNSFKEKPSFGKNLKFFFRYQVNHMYLRYFWWNFVGRQSNIQSNGGPLNGNWISGIPFIDKMNVGEKKSNMPDGLKNNKSRNQYYALPFILGLIGAIFHYKRKKKDFWVVMTLFFMTGLAIVIYLNQTPLQPRERDYAYAGSFYAFAIWIGLGVLGLIDLVGRKARNVPASAGVIAICLVLVPGIMAAENWDDHDRSGRKTALAIAKNYLDSCAPNAILFTNGDNDTFPLWYAQEVEEYRTDVRVVNLMLLNMDWYIDQMKRKAYDSEPLPISLTSTQYQTGSRDVTYIQDHSDKAYPAVDVMKWVASDAERTKVHTQSGKSFDFIPTRNFYVPVDSAKVIENKTVRESDRHLIVDRLEGRLKGNHIGKGDLVAFDIIANNNWERPIYFVSSGHNGTLGLEDYFQLDGFAYRLVPIRTKTSAYEVGRIDTEILYENFMKNFTYGNMNNPDVFLDNFHIRTLSVIRIRMRFARLANALIEEGDLVRAEEVLDKIVELTPHEQVPYDYFMPGIIESYYRLGAIDKANEIAEKMYKISDDLLKYYFSLDKRTLSVIQDELMMNVRVIGNLSTLTRQYGQLEFNERLEQSFTLHRNNLQTIM